MEKSFCFGLLLGAIGGALIAANSNKARQMIKKSQDEIKQKVTEFADEKIDEMTMTAKDATKESKTAVTRAKRA